MTNFTEREKELILGLARDYMWIARDKDGKLYLYDDEPTRDGYNDELTWWSSKYDECRYLNISEIGHMFNITWEDEPILISELIEKG